MKKLEEIKTRQYINDNPKGKISYATWELVFNYPTKYKQGFINSELADLVTKFDNFSEEDFNSALSNITCMVIDDNIIFYHIDVFHAILCGLEKRQLAYTEID